MTSNQVEKEQVMKLRDDARYIIDQSIQAVLPDTAVRKTLEQEKIDGKIHVIAVGKAAWRMAKAAIDTLGDAFVGGVVLTKYGHSLGEIAGMEILEAAHPIPDQNSLDGTDKILSYVQSIPEDENIVFLLSGGGSALFEKPRKGLTLDDLKDINQQLLESGASIVEINTIRKHLSEVKGGRFAATCSPRFIQSIILSDVVGNRVDTIASGPAYPDSSTSEETRQIIAKYRLDLPEKAMIAIQDETPKELENVKTTVIGSVEILCQEAEMQAQALGYHTKMLSTSIEEEASSVGMEMGELARRILSGEENIPLPCAIIAGGEPVVTIKGDGMGGRNQELALSAAFPIEGLSNVVIASVGSDGTDGPTDAAGGMVDGGSLGRIKMGQQNAQRLLDNNDSYKALETSGDLIFTGPTGTNVNDVILVLIDEVIA
jgi:glycerate 2-kinase